MTSETITILVTHVLYGLVPLRRLRRVRILLRRVVPLNIVVLALAFKL
jgi:hypothetical protein